MRHSCQLNLFFYGPLMYRPFIKGLLKRDFYKVTLKERQLELYYNGADQGATIRYFMLWVTIKERQSRKRLFRTTPIKTIYLIIKIQNELLCYKYHLY
jgi:hypothetical protein